MGEKTNNSKVITKNYLAEQFFLYHDKYIKGIGADKQASLVVDSKHLTWDNPKLGLNIDNDNSAEVNDYISLKNSDGTLTWKTPITDLSEIDGNNENLVTGKAVYNFEGSNSIKKVGTISEGSWNVGNIQINDNSLKISNFTIKQEETGELSIFSEGRNLGLKADYLSLNKNLTVTGDISAENINIETKLKAKEALIVDASIFDLIVSNTISAPKEDDFITFNNNIYVYGGDVKLDGDIIFTETADFSIKSDDAKYLTINQSNISLKNLTIEESYFTLGDEELTIATEAEINSFFDDWQS